MKIRNICLILLLTVLFTPVIVLADDCSSYTSEDTCPYSTCTWDSGSCKSGYIGDNFCSKTETKNIMRVLGTFIWIAKLFVPLLIIGFGVFDLMKGVTGGDEKAIKEGAKRFGIRLLIGISIFFLPTIIDAVLSAVDGFNDISSDYMACEKCLLKPNECDNS